MIDNFLQSADAAVVSRVLHEMHARGEPRPGRWRAGNQRVRGDLMLGPCS